MKTDPFVIAALTFACAMLHDIGEHVGVRAQWKYVFAAGVFIFSLAVANFH